MKKISRLFLLSLFLFTKTIAQNNLPPLYAVNEKAKQQPDSYEPIVSVSTKKINNIIELTVKDNGNDIPQNIADKIFQLFFTTKPTGEGTGLGLSLSYDIIKAHGGEIKNGDERRRSCKVYYFAAFILNFPK